MTSIKPPNPDRTHRRMKRRGSTRRRGVAIVLVIVAIAAAAIIGSAYVASQLNAPQIVGNVTSGIEARYIADSGADLATAIMECDTFDWRTAQINGVLVDNLPVGNGHVTIEVKDVAGNNPDSTCEYPVIVSKGDTRGMKQIVGMQVHAPRPAVTEKSVDVDLSEFAAFGNASIDVISGWITRWPASPMAKVGLPLKVGTNAVTNGALRIADATAAPDSIGYVMASAPIGTITDAKNGPAPIRRSDFSKSETVLLPAPPTPDLGGLLWATPKAPNITSDTNSTVSSDRRHTSLTVDNGATLTIDLAGGNRVVGISGPLLVQNGGVLQINNGHLDLVVQGALNMFYGGALCLGPDASLTLWIGGTMSIDDSVIGLPVRWRDAARDARKGADEYFDPGLCTVYRINAINSIDLTPLDADNATAWTWSDNTIKSWIISTNSYVCARIYGHAKVSFSLDNRSAVFGNIVANNIVVANESAIYYDHSLDVNLGYTNPDSALYAAPLDLRDDIRLALTDLNDSTLASINALLAAALPPPPVAIDPMAPTPRDKNRVAKRWWKRYGVKVNRDRPSSVEAVIAAEVK